MTNAPSTKGWSVHGALVSEDPTVADQRSGEEREGSCQRGQRSGDDGGETHSLAVSPHQAGP